MRTVTVVRDLGYAGNGGSQSNRFETADGERYLVKRSSNPQGGVVLVNELVAGCIATDLSLPCPEPSLVMIEPRLYPNQDPGPHFGVPWLGSAASVMDWIPTVSNRDEIPGVILFDLLTLNTDRNNPGNFIIEVKPDGTRHFVMIDHGHCFGYNASKTDLPAMVDMWQLNVLPQMLQCVVGADPFGPHLARLEALPDGVLVEAVDAVPRTWPLTDVERAALVGFLIARRGRLRSLMIQHRQSFPAWCP